MIWMLLRAGMRRFSRFKDVEAAIADRQAFEQRSREEIRAYQLDRFNALWQIARTQVPYYQKLQQSLALPDVFASIEEMTACIPVLEKSVIQADPQQFLPQLCQGSESCSKTAPSLPPGFWAQTSGSTGTPMRCYWALAAYLESQRDKYYHQSLWGVDLWDKTATLWGFSHFFQENLKGKLKFIQDQIAGKIRNKIAFSVYRVTRRDLKTWYRQIRNQQVRFLYALPNMAYLLAKANDQEPPLALKLVVVGGEPIFPDQQKTIEQVCGCPVAIEYGTIEVGLLASSYPDGHMHVCERGVLLETLPTPEGAYEILVTHLRNSAFPLIRYRIGDLAAAPLAYPAQGTATIGAIIGRQRDVFVSASGTVLNGLAFSRFFKDFPEITQYQVIQAAIDRVTVCLVCWTPLSAKLRSTIETKLRQMLGKDTVIDLQEVEKIEPTSAGKHRFIVSKVASQSAPSLTGV